MKKIIICILCLVMLAGCGTSSKKDSNDDRENKENGKNSFIQLETEESTEEIVEESTEAYVPFDKNLCGYWVHFRDVGEYRYTIHLIINEDGTAEYKSGIANSEFTLMYSGTWNDEGGTLNFDLQGGPPQDPDDVGLISLDNFVGSYNWSAIGENLLITFVSGDDFAGQSEGEPYNFSRM